MMLKYEIWQMNKSNKMKHEPCGWQSGYFNASWSKKAVTVLTDENRKERKTEKEKKKEKKKNEKKEQKKAKEKN